MSPRIEQIGVSSFSVFVTATCGEFTVFVSYRKDGTVNVVLLQPEPVNGQRGQVFPTLGDALASHPSKAMRDLLRATCGAAFGAVPGNFWDFLNKPLDL